MANELSMLQTIKTIGIYHGLPTFPQSFKDLRAVVVGASGISGQHMLRALSQGSERWREVFAVSRSRPDIPENMTSLVTHVAIDLLETPGEIASKLRDANVKADYIFFSAYLQPSPPPGQPLWSNSEELDEVNSKILENFLEALPMSGIQPRRIVLQTGTKHYGTHLGPTVVPISESDPRLPSPPYPANFYYTQEDLLFKYCKTFPLTSWNIIRPCWILGAVPGAAMNILFPLAVYASVKKYLGETLDFPGDWRGWEKEQMQSSAMMNSYLSEWAALSPVAKNHAFNAADGGSWTWGMFWPVLGSWYGLPWAGPHEDESKYHEVVMGLPPRGIGPPGKLRYSFSFLEWAQQPKIQETWGKIAHECGLTVDPFRNLEQIWNPTHIALVNTWPWSVRLEKAIKMGFHGHVDTLEVVREVFDRFAELKMIPPLENSGQLVFKSA